MEYPIPSHPKYDERKCGENGDICWESAVSCITIMAGERAEEQIPVLKSCRSSGDGFFLN
jgi:hypothetical protein